MEARRFMKKAILLSLPLLLYPILAAPYSLLNTAILVKVFGCGCPRVDETGALTANYFSANDITTLFWNGIALISSIISVFTAKQLPKLRMRFIYVIGIIILSVVFSCNLIQAMMWN